MIRKQFLGCLSAILLLIFVLGLNTAHATPINFALSGTATANSYYDVNYPSKAIDGNNATSWNAGDHGSAGDPNWLIFDLGSTKNVNHIHVFWEPNDGQYAGYTNIYNFYTGLTGSDWTLRTSGTFVDETGPIEFDLYYLSPELSMRYAKYEVVDGSHWSGVAELKFLEMKAGMELQSQNLPPYSCLVQA